MNRAGSTIAQREKSILIPRNSTEYIGVLPPRMPAASKGFIGVLYWKFVYILVVTGILGRREFPQKYGWFFGGSFQT